MRLRRAWIALAALTPGWVLVCVGVSLWDWLANNFGLVLVLALSPPIAALFWFLWGLPAYPFEVPGEDQLDRLRVHLAALEQDIEDRTAKYAELQAGVDEARALVELTEVQITAVRETLERAATRRVRRAWILSGLGFLISVGINYVVNWTSGAWKPSWLP